MTRSSPLSEYLRAQKNEGEIQDAGEFSLDLHKALAKLERFRMAAGEYMVKYLQSAVSLGASRFKVSMGVRYLDLAFEVQAGQLTGIESLGMAILDRAEYPSRGLRHLGVALQASIAISKSVILKLDGQPVLTISKGESKVGAFQLLQPTKMCRVEIVLLRKSPVQGFLRQRAAEAKSLVERCSFSPIPIFLDGRELERGWSRQLPSKWSYSHFYIAEAYLSEPRELPAFSFPIDRNQGFHSTSSFWSRWKDKSVVKGSSQSPTLFRSLPFPIESGFATCKVALAVASTLNRQARLIFVMDGASTEAKLKNWGFPGLQIVLSGVGLGTDLSELQVLEDEHYRERIERLQPALLRVAEKLSEIEDKVQDFVAPIRNREGLVKHSFSVPLGSMVKPNEVRVSS